VQGLEAVAATGGNPTREDFLSHKAVAYAEMGRLDDALNTLTSALAAGEKYDERVLEAEIYCLKGKFLLRKDNCDTAKVLHCFERALEISREQSAKSWELRATISLARLLASQGNRDEASARLTEIYYWFTEGFDTADLKEAKTLLDDLML
jgi:predicted ATPase